MRVTREMAAEHRARIVAVAARLFSERGFDAVGVDAIMAGAGLTHGGFYRHFRSKDDLAAEALAYGLAQSADRSGAHATMTAYAASYLSPRHRDDPGAGCLIASLAGDVARQSPAIRDALTAHLPAAVQHLTERVGGDDPAVSRARAITVLSGLVGALVLARAVNDPVLSGEILAAGRQAFGAAGPPKPVAS